MKCVGVLLILILVAAGPSAAASVADIAARFVAAEARRLGGSEFEGARQVKRSEARRTGQIAFAVLYTIESIAGGNNYSQYLVAFLTTNHGPTPTRAAVVGGKFYRSVSLDSVDVTNVVLRTKNYRKGDAICCPSLDGVSKYWLQGGELAEGPGLRFDP
jgi:hypothetical protein